MIAPAGLRWAGAATLVIALAGCSSDGPTTQPARTPVEEIAGPATESSPTSPPTNPPEPTSTTEPTPVVEPTLTGELDVGVTTRLPVLPVEWTTSPLELPERPDGTWLAHVAIVEDAFVAVAFGWDRTGRQVVTWWRSDDGRAWARKETTLPAGSTMYDVIAFGGRLYATGQRVDDSGVAPRLWTTPPDLDSWSDVDLSTADVGFDGVWVAGLAATDAGIVIGGRREQYEPSRPVTFEAKGFRYEQNDATGTFELLDVATARVIAAGRTDELYSWDPDGQPVFDLTTGERLTVIPWDAWQQQPPRSPLPIPLPMDYGPPEPMVVELDGYRITIDDVGDRYEVVDVASGVVVTSGSASDFYRGPSPRFVDAATSEVAVTFTWDEWDELMALAYAALDDLHVAHESELLVIFSADGVRWSAIELDDDPNHHLDAVAAIGEVFVVTVVTHSESGETRWTLTSTDGIDWVRSDPVPGRHVDAMEGGDVGAIGLSWSEAGSTIGTSVDGRIWTTSLTLGEQPDGRQGWFDSVAAGPRAVAAVATVHTEPAHTPLTITVASRTAQFDVDGTAVEITDDLTGDVLLRATWEELQRAALGEIPTIADYANGSTSFRADGDVVMVIPDELVVTAYEEAAEAERAGTDHVVFARVDGGWYEISLPHRDGSTAGPLAIGDGVLVTALTTYDDTIEWEGTDGEGAITPERIEVFVGRFATPTG